MHTFTIHFSTLVLYRHIFVVVFGYVSTFCCLFCIRYIKKDKKRYAYTLCMAISVYDVTIDSRT